MRARRVGASDRTPAVAACVPTPLGAVLCAAPAHADSEPLLQRFLPPTRAATYASPAAHGCQWGMSLFPTSEAPPRRDRNEQLPLGAHPSYDDVLDVAVQYTFPCSDPISVDSSCADAARRQPDGDAA